MKNDLPKHFCIALSYIHNYLYYCSAFFNPFSPAYLCFLWFIYNVFSLYIEISLRRYNQPSRKYSVFSHSRSCGQGRGSTFLHLSQPASSCAQEYSQIYRAQFILDKTYPFPNPRSDRRPLQVLFLWDIWLWFCFSCVPCSGYHEASCHPCWTFRLLPGALLWFAHR